MIDPATWLASRTTQPDWDGRVATLSMPGFYPLSEHPGRVDIRDIAYGLAHTWRCGGQAKPATTVAEHVLLVSSLIEEFWPNRRDLQRAGLMHDSVEAYLHDVQAPIREHIKVTLSNGRVLSWGENDERLIKIIGQQFGILPELFDAVEVRCCDIMAFCFEQRDTPSLENEPNGLPPIPPQVAHLQMRFLSPDRAEDALLDRMRELGLIS